jgi:hypothetical protein
MEQTEEKSVRYEISEIAYWLVAENSARTKMGKSEFVSLLIERYARELKVEEE